MLPLAYMGVIYGLSSIPGTVELNGLTGLVFWVPPQIQNFLHIPLYAGLTLLWLWTLSRWASRQLVVFSAAFSLAVIYGALDEFHQLHVPGRFASLVDIALNALGAGLAIAWAIVRATRQLKVT